MRLYKVEYPFVVDHRRRLSSEVYQSKKAALDAAHRHCRRVASFAGLGNRPDLAAALKQPVRVASCLVRKLTAKAVAEIINAGGGYASWIAAMVHEEGEGNYLWHGDTTGRLKELTGEEWRDCLPLTQDPPPSPDDPPPAAGDGDLSRPVLLDL